ncbi:MAG: sel1 repeat family protein [Alphaproteobacteria bacterium]|nr:sel1 repeat family protein [Alphaproteobacteria bacterium]
MKTLENKNKSLNLKTKSYYAGVALGALISASSPSQAMENDYEMSRVRCLWHLEQKPSKNKVYRAAALEILEKKATQEQADTKTRLSYLKKLGQFKNDHPYYPLNLELLKGGNENDELPVSNFFETSKNAIEGSELSPTVKTFQTIKLQTFYLNLPQNITQLSSEKRKTLRDDINKFTTSLLLKGGKEITRNDLNYFKSYYDAENHSIKDLEKLLTEETPLKGKINYKLGLNIIENGDICRVSSQEAFFSAAAGAGHSLGAYYFAELNNTDSAAHTGAGFYHPDTACISYSDIANKGNRAKAFSLASYKLAKFYETGLKVDRFHLTIDLTESLTNLIAAARHGHPYAQYELAKNYIRTEVNAIRLLHHAAESGYYKAQFELAQKYPEGGEDALFWYHKVAVQEEGEAANYPLGYAYEIGKEYEKAISFYEKSKDPRAYVRLGKMYLEGMGKEKDESLALKQFERAASQGNADGNYCLGLMKLKGQGFQKPMIEEAVDNFNIAAKEDHLDALFQIGIMKQFGIGTEKSYAEAKTYYERAKTPEALYHLGNLYKQGLGGEKNIAQAFSAWEEAAKLGHIGAAYKVGKLYLNRLADKNDEKKTVQYLKQASSANHLDAIYLLGFLHEKGIGLERNPREEKECYTLAADAGHASAQFKLGKLYETTLEPDDYIKAFNYYTLAAPQGHLNARLALGTLYQEGKGTPKNLDEAFACYKALPSTLSLTSMKTLAKEGHQDAIGWFKNKAEKGNPNAQKFLGKLLELEADDVKEAIKLYQQADTKRSANRRLEDFKQAHLLEALNIKKTETFSEISLKKDEISQKVVQTKNKLLENVEHQKAIEHQQDMNCLKPNSYINATEQNIDDGNDEIANHPDGLLQEHLEVEKDFNLTAAIDSGVGENKLTNNLKNSLANSVLPEKLTDSKQQVDMEKNTQENSIQLLLNESSLIEYLNNLPISIISKERK